MKPDSNVVEIDEDEHERVLAVAAAVDVAKATGMVCVRRPHPSVDGRRVSRVWEVEATTNSILALGEDLVALGVERVVLESTSDYWRPFVRHEALSDRGEVKGLLLRAVAAAR